MSSPFAITAATNTVSLDSNRQAQSSFTVSNATAHTVRGRAHIVAQPTNAEPWFRLLGEAERVFASAGTEQYGVQITVPLNAPADDYTFRLNMVDLANPDEDYSEGPPVRFVVTTPVQVKKPFSWWIVAVIAGVIILLVGGYYSLSQVLLKGTPKVIPTQGLVLWLKSDTGTTLNGSNVSQWIDQSGDGHNAIQNMSSAQPALVNNAINGKPVLRFNGSSDIMSTSGVVTTSTQYTIFVVSTLGNAPTTPNSFGIPGPFYNGNSSISGYGFFRNNQGNYGSIDGGVAFLTFGAISGPGSQMQEMTRDSNGAETFYVNGIPSGSTVMSRPNSPSGVTFVGGLSTKAQDLFNGDIAEIIFYDHPLSATDRQSVERYLKSKYNL